MKKKFLCLGLTSLFLLGCSNKVEEIDLNNVKNKIENKEDFIMVLTSKGCGHCKNLKETYQDSDYDFNFFEISFDSIVEGVKNKEEEAIETYKYLAEVVDYSFSNVISFLLDDTYGHYLRNEETNTKYEDLSGKDKYLEGYINLVTPLSMFYVKGELVNFEYGDFSSDLDIVMSKYQKAIEKGPIMTYDPFGTIPFNPFNYIKDVTYTDYLSKLDNKDDFIFILSSKSCSHCKGHFDDIYNNLEINPVDIYYYYVDDMLISLEMDNEGFPLNGVEAYNAAVKEYRYFASVIEEIGDFILGGEGKYIENNYTTRFTGEKEAAIIYPATFVVIDGEVAIELSYLGRGWAKTQETFSSFVNLFKSLANGG